MTLVETAERLQQLKEEIAMAQKELSSSEGQIESMRLVLETKIRTAEALAMDLYELVNK